MMRCCGRVVARGMAAHGRLSLAAIAAARRGRVHALRRSVVTPPLNRFTARLHVARGVRADDANNNDSSDHVTAIKNDQHRLPVQCAGCGVALQTQQPGGTGYVNPNVVERWQQQEAERKAALLQDTSEAAQHLHADAARAKEPIPFDFINDDGSAAALHGFDLSEDELFAKETEPNRPICQRCHRIRHHNEDVSPQPVEDMAAKLRELRQLSATQQRLGICVVDISDFPCSLPDDLIRRADLAYVMVAVNKADALAMGIGRTNAANRIRNWVASHYRTAVGRKPVSVHLVSAHTRQGIPTLFKDVYEYCQKHRTEAFIFGATNVGKSSVINAIVQPKEKATVSQRPGTTLGPICFSLDMQGRHIIGHSTTYHTTHEAPLPIFGLEEVTVYDTPGAPYPSHVASVLAAEELSLLQPKARPAPRTFALKPLQAVVVGAIASLDVTAASRPSAPLVTVVASPHLRPHVTRSERVLELLSVHAGTPPFQPPLTREAAEALPARVPHTFTFRGAGWKRACGEVTVAGVCSFVITYADEAEVTITVWAPQGVGVVERLPLELEIAALRGKRLGAKSRGFEARKAKNRRR